MKPEDFYDYRTEEEANQDALRQQDNLAAIFTLLLLAIVGAGIWFVGRILEAW